MKENISKNKVWQIIGVAVLCAVCVLTAVLGIVFGMNHSSEDLNVSKDMSEKPDDSVVIETTEENGIMLTSGVATTAADGTKSKVLTATVTPSAASRLDYTWSVAFKNSNSTWAKSRTVTDYVTVSQDSSNKLKATVTYKNVFSEQIVVTVSCDLKPTIKATATVDCYKEVIELTGQLIGSQKVVPFGPTEPSDYILVENYSINCGVTCGDGTLDGTLSVKYRLDNGVETALSSNALKIADFVSSGETFSTVSLIFYYNDTIVFTCDFDVISFANSISLSDTGLKF